MSVLITGGHGMLGSALDFGLKPTKGELNLLDYTSLSRYIQDNGVNEIVHAAGKVGGVKANNDYVCDFFLENLLINTSILTACKEHNIKKSTFFLSTCVFPHQAPLPLKEGSINQGEPHPTNFGYAYAKRMLEVGSRCLNKQHGISSCCIIPCNMYGKNDNYHLENGHVIPSLIHRCYLAKQNGTEFLVWGSGKAEREFVYVDDMASVVKHIHTKQMDDLPPLMIVSPGYVHTIAEVVEVIVKHIGYNGRVVFDSTKSEGIMRKNTDNSLFRSRFSDFKFTDLDTGMAKTVEHFVKNYSNIRK